MPMSRRHIQSWAQRVGLHHQPAQRSKRARVVCLVLLSDLRMEVNGECLFDLTHNTEGKMSFNKENKPGGRQGPLDALGSKDKHAQPTHCRCQRTSRCLIRLRARPSKSLPCTCPVSPHWPQPPTNAEPVLSLTDSECLPPGCYPGEDLEAQAWLPGPWGPCLWTLCPYGHLLSC